MPCVLATNFFSFYVGAAVLAVLFPLFILVAMDSEPGDIMSGGCRAVGGCSRQACGQHGTAWLPCTRAMHLSSTPDCQM